MLKLVINADDCGISKEVNTAIRRFIEMGKVSSTTIMANMDDFVGAIDMYREMHNDVSFGIHLNLTQGRPLHKSQCLLDYGLLKETDDGLVFHYSNPKTLYFPYCVMKDVELELSAQIEKILDNGVSPTHIDSHHFIHTYPTMLFLTPKLCRKYSIKRIRRMRNTTESFVNRCFRNAWFGLEKLQNADLISTDFFTAFGEFSRNIKWFEKQKGSLELMCHPGGFDDAEASLMETTDLSQFEIISYHNI